MSFPKRFAIISGHKAERRGDSVKAISSPPLKKSLSWLDTIDKISEYTGKYLSWLILAIVTIIWLEVFLRFAFNAPTIWVHECSTYLFGAYFALGGAYALRMGKMVNVDIWINMLNPRKCCMVKGVTGVVGVLFLVALLYVGIPLAYSSVIRNEGSETAWGPPIYPFKIVAVVGTLLLLLQVLSKIVRDFAFAFKRGTGS